MCGAIVGTINGEGYLVCRIDDKVYLLHRLAFLYMTGSVPSEIDHINGVRTDNRFANLRAISRGENNQNRRHAQGNSKSGLIGAHWMKEKGRWYSQIKKGGKNHFLGYFDTKEAAHAAYIEAKKRIHPAFDPGDT